MKKILLILFVAAAAFPFQNCNKGGEDDPDPVDTTKKDTTPVVIEPLNSFKVNGISTFKLKWDSTNMFGSYRVGTATTTILCEGYSAGELATFKLVFPGSVVGTFKYSDNPIVNIEVTTGQNVKYKKYVFEDISGRDMTITVTKYDPVGGHIKGTFSGFLQETSSITSANITNGAFEVVREVDEQ